MHNLYAAFYFPTMEEKEAMKLIPKEAVLIVLLVTIIGFWIFSKWLFKER